MQQTNEHVQSAPQPQYLQLESYDNVEQIRNQFQSLNGINQQHKFDNLDKSKFFIIRTQGEDNVHKAMKYGIWTSSSRKNERLNEAFKSVKKTHGDVYLFFTEINSLCFSGMAKLVGEFDAKSHFKYWLIENKWFGTFQIQWLYVKDLQFKHFEELKQVQKLEGSEETLKSVYDLIDCTELAQENGYKMVKIFQKEESKTSLFEHFPQLDKLEYDCREERNNNQRFERKFKELAQVFETIPFSFSVASYERKKLQRKGPYYGQQQQQQQYYYGNPYGNYYPQQQQQYMGYPQQQQYQQQGGYWQNNNNGFYQNQGQYQQNRYPPRDYQYKDNNQQRQSNEQQQQQYVQQPQQQQQQYQEETQDVPLQNKFQIKKGGKNEKKRMNNNKIQYVEKDNSNAVEQVPQKA